MVALKDNVETLAEHFEHADSLQTAYGHEDAEEEEYGVHVDA